MIRSVLSLRARDGRAGALEDFFRDRGILDRARHFPGCRGTTLWRAVPPGTAVPGEDVPYNGPTHIVFADWDSTADYEGWVNDPWRASVNSDLAALLEVSPSESTERIVGGMYEPVDDHPASAG